MAYEPDIPTLRLRVCNQCEFLTIVKMCSRCGCVVPLKVRMPSSSCPEGKWLAVIPKKS
jgi:rRNA maturation protein Nop10